MKLNPASTRRYWGAMALLVSLLLVLWLATDPGQKAGAAFPGQNGRIAFSARSTTFRTTNSDGSCQLGEFEGADVAWSADGQRIAATRYGVPSADVIIMNSDGSNVTNLTSAANPDSPDILPNWSPNGEKIVFVSFRDGNAELYLMDADGGGQTRLTDTPDEEFYPVWSPNGQYIAFDSGATGDHDIYLLDLLSGDPPVNLTNTPGENERRPDWSPDGLHISFDSAATGLEEFRDVYVMEAGGGNRTNLTDTADGYELKAVWSPDGTLIAYQGDEGFMVMKANGSDKRLLVAFDYGYGVNQLDDWQPLLEQETTIEIAKTVFGREGVWPFSLNGEPFSLVGDQCKVFENVDPGTYKVEEGESPGYDQSVTCNNGASGGTVVEFEIAESERVTCTFVNAVPPDLTIYLEVIGHDAAEEWSFLGTGSIGAFTLSNFNFRKFDDLEPGEYTITQTVPEGYTAEVGCNDSNHSTGTDSVTVELVGGQDVSCSFRNRKLADLTIEKIVVGDLPAADWQFGGDMGDFMLPAAGGETTFTNIQAGDDTTITELPVALYETEIACFHPGSDVIVDADEVQGGIRVYGDGLDTTCQFTNTHIEVGYDLFLPVIAHESPGD